MKRMKIAVFILSKNEERNIGRCLESLKNTGWPVFILDSGSTDKTLEICSHYPFSTTLQHKYINHCESYNSILSNLATEYDYAIILDSDMMLSDALKHEIVTSINHSDRAWCAMDAEVEMWVEGVALSRASLYPPKPFLFRAGESLFVSTGHAEKLIDGTASKRALNKIIHDDRKPYSSYLQSQFRYSGNLVNRYHKGNVSRRDKIRVNWPLMILAVPFFSLFIRRGFMDGRAGIIYALDRLIAEAIMYRQALADRMLRNRKDRHES